VVSQSKAAKPSAPAGADSAGDGGPGQVRQLHGQPPDPAGSSGHQDPLAEQPPVASVEGAERSESAVGQGGRLSVGQLIGCV
jgi:hypothetical protein